MDHQLGFDQVPTVSSSRHSVTDTIIEEEDSETNNTQTGSQETQTATPSIQTGKPTVPSTETEAQSTNSNTVQPSSETQSDTQSTTNSQSQSSDTSFKVPEVSLCKQFEANYIIKYIMCDVW